MSGSQRERSLRHVRLLVIAAAVVLACRLFYVQVIRHGLYLKLAAPAGP